MFQEIINRVRIWHGDSRLPETARNERIRDRRGLEAKDPGCERVIIEGIQWLARAQDYSLSQDGGVARDYGLINGWASSYPETTGYIIPTFIDYADRYHDEEYNERAKRMLNWCESIQYPEGGFQGGKIDSQPAVPVTFNTGQILLGLAAGTTAFGHYREAMRRAADWLVATQDQDGCWRQYPTPFAKPGEKAYETHVAWGLLEAARLEPDKPYAEAALCNIRWALAQQRSNGWFQKCCLSDPERPLTHTIGYVLRGLIEAYRFFRDPEMLAAARSTADALLNIMSDDGYLPGQLRSDWTPAVGWVCLTGSVQIASCWLLLYRETNDIRYREAGVRANRYVRRTIHVDGPPEVRGAVKGSFPIDGDYGRYEYLNWAVKFTIDANLLEKDIRASEQL